MRRIIAGFASLVIVSLASVVLGQERHDVTFTTPFPPGKRPTTANFYYNDRAIGSGREAFEEILKWISELPVGTSIVWGPNYDRCGSCSGSEPGCLPKHLYLELWKQLEEVVMKRKLTLSSGYPTPWSRSTLRTSRHEFPKQVFADRAPENAPFDAVLDWEVGEASEFVLNRDRPKGAEYAARRLHRLSSNKTSLVDYDLHLFFGRLPERSRVLVRLTLRDKVLKNGEATTAIALAEEIAQAWDSLLSRHLRRGSLKAAIVIPTSLAKAFEERRPAEHLNIEWRNFHGPNTPHDEVLYLANDAYLGRGDEGFDQILDRVDRLLADARVTLPLYQLGGKRVAETLDFEEIEARNAKLKDLVPFQQRKPELDAKLTARQVKLESERISPGSKDGTVLDWDSRDRYAQTIASFGHI
ncbi:MAG: hypothetical protein IAG10_28720, partial [Planctomycetaceae bacterium]|nr:hypothetical protein [Planctomycetaceae bacterium]